MTYDTADTPFKAREIEVGETTRGKVHLKIGEYENKLTLTEAAFIHERIGEIIARTMRKAEVNNLDR